MRRYPANYLTMPQGSPEWFNARLGLVTASRVADAIAMLKNGKPAQSRENYKIELLTEILTGSAAEHYVSPEMDYGRQNEPIARANYELERGVAVDSIGFVLHPRLPRTGASPDGLVGDDGLVEIKVPKTTTHLRYLIAGVVPEDYFAQIQWQLACSERQWCDFVSYNLELPEDFSMFVVRVERDNTAIRYMEEGVEQFIRELNSDAEKLQAHVAAHKPKESDLPGVPKAEIPAWGAVGGEDEK